jgi:hypothetical protein
MSFRPQLAVAAAISLLGGFSVHADDTGFASSHTLRKEGGKLCMADHAHSGSGTAATKPAAKVAAIRAWAEFTSFEYGSDWARYSRAAGHVVRYTKEEKGWTATVDARPCK